ncbi:MAG: 3-phenylpropionate/cinnamic acid dioxygenase subunit beta [Chloroflexota bacterium]|nr:3-phenylpropionate/cinnamic acid dioxygenase subunit beta [Chloroflexota bacterium]MDE2884756.1 3-phenylpropionate/cinnamic acid dioxygenase subunit beta [Chloroflexota bacterium]
MAAPLDLQPEVERFLYYEALLLDEGRFNEWLDLLTDDIRYLMPTAESVQSNPDAAAPEVSLSYMDEGKELLALRVRQLDTGLRHVEVPASLTRRLVTNVLIVDAPADDELNVASNFLVFQIRHGRHESQFSGTRRDRLRRVDGGWKLCERTVLITQPVLPRAVSIFF